jgi:hypothetical protein
MCMCVCIYIYIYMTKIYIHFHIHTNRPQSGALNLRESHTRALQLLDENIVNLIAVRIFSEMDY